MEHCIDVIGEAEYPCLRPNIVVKLNKAISELHSFHPDCRIQRVSGGLRRAKPDAYEPIVVSIGPYHLRNPRLQEMKNHKLWYLHLLLERRKEKVEKYIVEMKELEDRVRKCYVETIDLNSEDFVEMMLLDACFIIEFFRKIRFNPILNVHCMEAQICRDLMLLENQLPFFLLSHFNDMIKNPNPNNGPGDPDHDPEYPKTDPDDVSLLELALSSFSNIIPSPCLKYLELAKTHDPGKIKHLLHLVHLSCCPSPKQTASSELRNTKKDKLDDILSAMQSAVELQEAGVKFKRDKSANLFDIKFNNGLMVVPCVFVDNTTMTFFGNLIAFEQYTEDIVPKYFTEYVGFMVQLISSGKDVKLLRNKRIIVNHLGDDWDIIALFNKLCDGVIVPFPTSYVDVCKAANMHCNKPRNTLRAYLLRAHGYFDTPFATASTIAAVVLLVLTLLQTIAVFIYK